MTGESTTGADGALNRLNPDPKVRSAQVAKDFGTTTKGMAGGSTEGGNRVDVARCLDAMVLTGKIARESAERIIKRVAAAETNYANHVNPTSAEALAAKKVMEKLAEEANKRKQQVSLQLLAQHRIIEQAGNHPQGFVAGVLSHLTKDWYGKADWSNVEYRHKAIMAQLNAMAGDLIYKYTPTRLGTRENVPAMRSFVRELYGEGTGDEGAAAAAKAWRDTSEYARERFNQGGGDIKKRSDWNVPQVHDQWRVREAGREEWTRFVDGLNYEIRDPETGDILSSSEASNALKEMWGTIGSGGMKKVRLGAGFGVAKLANTRADPRLLQFKDASSWLAYNDRFGAGSIYRLAVGHLDGIARDISMLEVLGPNPDATMHFLSDAAKMATATGNPNAIRIAQLETQLSLVNERIKARTKDLRASSGEKEAALPEADSDIASRKALGDQIGQLRSDVRPPEGRWHPRNMFEDSRAIQATYDVVAQKSETTESWFKEWMLRRIADLRGVMSTAQLGSALLSSTTDLKTLQATTAWNGLDSTRTLSRQLSLLNPRNAADRDFARRAGIIADEVVRMASAAQRFQDDVGEGFVARMTEGFHRITGLTPWTYAARGAFGLEFMGALADNAGKELKDLPPLLRRAIEGKGVTTEMWDAVRKLPLADYRGGKFMIPWEVAREGARTENRAAADAGQRLHELILQETDYAIPEPDARVQSIMTLGTKRGTLMGELWRTATMYKSFPMSVVALHALRAMTAHGEGGLRTKPVGYAADMLLGMTVMGAAAVQLKQVASGRDPRDMTSSGFWGEAFFQGGGLGIFGDFLRAGLSRKDQDLTSTLVGPGVGLVGDVARLTSQNIRQAADGVPTHFAGEAVRFAQRYTPGTNIWYARLAMDRLLWSRLHMLAEPNFPAIVAKMQGQALKEYNQRYFWQPGAMTPDRGPSAGAAIGMPPQ